MSEDSYADLSYRNPRVPSITHPLQRPHPVSRKNLFQFYSGSSDEEDDKAIKVYLRMKPRKHRLEGQEMLHVQDQSTLLLKSTKEPDVEYKFTKIFAPRTDQETIFEECVLPSIKGFTSGQNCLLFAYGASSAGKTYTIQGTQENPGIIPRAVTAVFNSIRDQESTGCKFKPHLASSVVEMDENAVRRELAYKHNLLSGLQRNDSSRSIRSLASTQESTFSSQSEFSISGSSCLDIRPSFNGGEVAFSVWVSFIEIYNEQIFDLLVPPSDRKRRPLILGQDSAGDVYVKGLQHVWVNSAEEAYQVLLCGQQNLNYASTNLNAASSRSHCVFSLKLICEFKGIQRCRLSRFSFCDLAGAERAKKTENVGDRLKESQKINTSLHYLGMCLRIIRDNQNSKDKSMIPFRDCKLTRLFQKALLGREAIRMIVNVSLDPYLYDETSQVLKFSAIAKQVVLQERRPHALRKESRFSRYLRNISSTSKFSSVSQEDSYASNPINVSLLNQRIEELVNEVSRLKLQLDVEKKEKVTLERRIREDVADRYDKLLEETEKMYRSRLEDAELHYLEMEQWRCNKMEQYIHKMSKKRRRESDDSYEEQEHLEKQVESLTTELKSVKELLESRKLQSDELLRQNSKLQFQIADVTEKLKIAEMGTAAEGSASDGSIAKELKQKLLEKTEELKMKKIEVQELKEVIKDAKVDYEQLEETHHLVVKEVGELEKKYEDKTADLRDAEDKLNICHKQFDSLYGILDSKDEEIEALKAGYPKAIEELNRQIDWLIKSFEETLVQVRELRTELRNDAEASDGKLNKLVSEISEYIEAGTHNSTSAELEQKLKDAEAKIEEVELVKEHARREADEALLSKQEMEEKLLIMEKSYKQTLKDLIAATTALEEEQKVVKEQKIVSEKELGDMKDQLKTYVSGVNKMEQELEQLHAKYQDAEEENEMLINQLKEKELEMKSFKTNRDKIFKSYEEKLRKEKESTDVHKREIQRLQELFRKNTPNTPNKRDYEEKLRKLTEELEQKDEELKKCYVKIKGEDKHVSRRQRRRVVVDENLHPSQWVTKDPKKSSTLTTSTPKEASCRTNNTGESRSEDRSARRRRALFAPAVQPDQLSPREYEAKIETSPIRALRSRRF